MRINSKHENGVNRKRRTSALATKSIENHRRRATETTTTILRKINPFNGKSFRLTTTPLHAHIHAFLY